MRCKWHIVLNKDFLFSLTATAVCLLFACGFFSLTDSNDGVLFAILCLLLSLGGVFLMLINPVAYFITEEQIRFIYILGFEEYAKWADIKSICRNTESSAKRTATYYEIYPMEGRTYFFTENRVRKSLRMRRLIKRYWRGEIEGDISLRDRFSFKNGEDKKEALRPRKKRGKKKKR